MKHHFCNSEWPLKEGTNLTARCGATISKAHFVAFLDTVVVGCAFAVQATNMCRKCNNGDLPKRFVYVVAPGQEAMTVKGDM